MMVAAQASTHLLRQQGGMAGPCFLISRCRSTLASLIQKGVILRRQARTTRKQPNDPGAGVRLMTVVWGRWVVTSSVLEATSKLASLPLLPQSKSPRMHFPSRDTAGGFSL